MPKCAVEFSVEELRQLRDLGIAVFRNKIILDAREPVTELHLARIRKKLTGEIPPELMALWSTSFGGSLDYDFEVMFGDHLYSSSLGELFYSGSKHYRDLDGWIDHEIELFEEVAEERGEPVPTRSSVIPFGGFEYLERFYTSLEPNEYGAVLVYAQGIPWKGALNENSVAFAARNVYELFDQLALNSDPFEEPIEEYAKGNDTVERILELEANYPILAKKLKSLVRASIVDWRTLVGNADYGRELSALESKALRIALGYAVKREDVSIVDLLHQIGAPFHLPLYGKQGVLHHALAKKAWPIVERLLDVGVEIGDVPIIHASECSDELLLMLIEYGALFDEEAIYSAAETGAIDGAIALVHSEQVVKFEGISRVAASVSKRAARHDEDAVRVESGKLGSYLTAGQYRERAKALRDFTDRLRSSN